MIYTIVGLFANNNNVENISKKLENVGFKNEDYIIYISEKNEEKRSFWKNFLTDEVKQNPEDDGQIISVFVNNDAQENVVKEIFGNFHVIHTYELKDISPEEATSLQLIRNTVNARVKGQIYALPNAKMSHDKHEMITLAN